MSASDHVHPNQLAMFLPAGELRGMLPGDAVYGGSDEDLWDQKEREDQYMVSGKDGNPERIGESIRQHGVLNPVEVYHGFTIPEIYEGHHRIAISAAIDPSREVPVIHRSEYTRATEGEEW
jgi:hypothetical protein